MHPVHITIHSFFWQSHNNHHKHWGHDPQCWFCAADDGLHMDVCTLPGLCGRLPAACSTQRHSLVPIPLLLQLLLGTVWSQRHHLVAAWRAVPHRDTCHVTWHFCCCWQGNGVTCTKFFVGACNIFCNSYFKSAAATTRMLMHQAHLPCLCCCAATAMNSTAPFTCMREGHPSSSPAACVDHALVLMSASSIAALNCT